MKTVQAMLAEAEAEVPRISPDEAKGLLGKPDVLFLDVREPAEVATTGKVPGALAVPRGLVEFRADPNSAMQIAVSGHAPRNSTDWRIEKGTFSREMALKPSFGKNRSAVVVSR